ncbi:MAG: RNA polymerase sigma factor [Alistipes onderdonkii]
MEPAELISAIRAGSREAFDEMCGRYYAPLTAYARLFLNGNWAQDVVQDVFVNVWVRREALDPGSRSTGTCSARSITSRSTTSTSTAMRAATAPTTRNVSKASATPITIPTGIRSSKSSTRKICARASTRRSQPSRPNAARSFR